MKIQAPPGVSLEPPRLVELNRIGVQTFTGRINDCLCKVCQVVAMNDDLSPAAGIKVIYPVCRVRETKKRGALRGTAPPH